MGNLLAPVRAAYTDDEVVALTMAAEVQWGRAMISVDLMDPKDIAKAEFRGVRSLSLRDVSDELVHGELMPVLVAGEAPAAIVLLVDDGLLVQPNAMRIEFYRHGAGIIECGVLPNGTYLFQFWPDGQLAAFVADLLTVSRDDEGLATLAFFPGGGADNAQGLLAGADCQLVTFTPNGPSRQVLGVSLSEQRWHEQAISLC